MISPATSRLIRVEFWQEDVSVAIHVMKFSISLKQGNDGTALGVVVFSPQKDFFFFKSETELTAGILKKRSKAHKRLKERFLIRQNRTKRANFRGSLLFQVRTTTQQKTVKPIYLVSVSCLIVSLFSAVLLYVA